MAGQGNGVKMNNFIVTASVMMNVKTSWALNCFLESIFS